MTRRQPAGGNSPPPCSTICCTNSPSTASSLLHMSAAPRRLSVSASAAAAIAPATSHRATPVNPAARFAWLWFEGFKVVFAAPRAPSAHPRGGVQIDAEDGQALDALAVIVAPFGGRYISRLKKRAACSSLVQANT